MSTISQSRIQEYRAETFRLKSHQCLTSLQDAIQFVNQRGFVYFWPIKGIILPSLWAAVAGDRQVASTHDDPGHVTWGWKDDALGQRVWYYGKILRKKATMIALDVVPYFYALSENYGDPEEDVRIQYHEGHLTLEAKSIFDALSENGPLDTISIRQMTRMTSKDSNSRFDRALALLQSDFKIMPVGISDAGAWRYAFIYDLTHRQYPDILEKARKIKEKSARKHLTRLYFLSVGAAEFKDIIKLFHWSKLHTQHAVDALIDEEFLLRDLEVENQTGSWIALKVLS
jgi:hypothetical protein